MPEPLKNLHDSIAKADKATKDFTKDLKGLDATGTKALKDLDEAAKKTKSSMEHLKDAGNKVVDSFDAMTQGATVLPGVLGKLERKLMDLDERWKSNRKTVMDMGLSWRNEFGKMLGAADHWDYKMSQLSVNLYTDLSKIQEAATQLSDFFNPSEIFDTEGLRYAGKSMGLVETSMRLAMATGMDFADVSNFMKTTIKGLGIGAKDAANYFVLMANKTKEAGMSMKAFMPIIQDISKDYMMYGLDMRGAIQETVNISKAMGNNKMIVGDLAKAMMGGFKGMSDSGEAFFGLMGKMPGSTGGALEAALGFERSLTDKGKGLKDVVTGMATTLKGLFGGQLLNREKAIATNQAPQYWQQRSLTMSQMGMDKATADKFLTFLAARDEGKTELNGENVNQTLEDLTKTSTDYAKETTTATQQLLLETKNLVSISRKNLVVSAALDNLKHLKVGGAVINTLWSVGQAIMANQMLSAIVSGSLGSMSAGAGAITGAGILAAAGVGAMAFAATDLIQGGKATKTLFGNNQEPNIADISKKAFGGIVTQPTLALVGEGGRAERITNVGSEIGGDIRIIVDIKDGIRTIAQKTINYNIATHQLSPGRAGELGVAHR